MSVRISHLEGLRAAVSEPGKERASPGAVAGVAVRDGWVTEDAQVEEEKRILAWELEEV